MFKLSGERKGVSEIKVFLISVSIKPADSTNRHFVSILVQDELYHFDLCNCIQYLNNI